MSRVRRGRHLTERIWGCEDGGCEQHGAGDNSGPHFEIEVNDEGLCTLSRVLRVVVIGDLMIAVDETLVDDGAALCAGTRSAYRFLCIPAKSLIHRL